MCFTSTKDAKCSERSTRKESEHVSMKPLPLGPLRESQTRIRHDFVNFAETDR